MKNKFECEYCKKVFTTKYGLTKHENKTLSCLNDYYATLTNKITNLKTIINRLDDKSYYSNEHLCEYCNTNYKSKYIVKKHFLNNCNERKIYESKLKKITDELKVIEDKINNVGNNTNLELKSINNNQIDNKQDDDLNDLNNLNKDDLVKMIKEMREKEKENKTNNTRIINNTANITNNNINNGIQIILNNYDEPNNNYLTHEQKTKFLNNRYKGIIDYIQAVYLNKDHPENHTILVSNMRSNHALIYKDDKWIAEEVNEVADKINEASFNELTKHLDDLTKNDKTNKYSKEINKGQNFVKYFTDNDTSKQSRSNIKKTLYNNRDIILKTKNNIKKYKDDDNDE